MKFHHRSVVGQLLPLLLVVGSTYAQDTTTTATTTTTTTMEEPQCGIYMAGSTLGDTTNLGMYAGHDIPPGVEVQQEIAIPLLFRNWDGPDYYDTTDGELWDRYIWEGEVANLETYDNTDALQSKAVFVPGIGCTINSMLDMNNVESTHGSTYDLAGLHRSKDPGSGAFTPYYNTHTTSVEHIPAGSEIFAAYGDVRKNDVVCFWCDFLFDWAHAVYACYLSITVLDLDSRHSRSPNYLQRVFGRRRTIFARRLLPICSRSPENVTTPSLGGFVEFYP